MSIRLCKYLADSGLCSRRQASRLIEQGRLLVNGTLATHTCHVSTGDSIVLDGMALAAPEAKQLWLYHKPVGIDCNLTADKADSLLHVLQHLPVRLYPIGRLDKDSSGLLLLTNDGALTHSLIHPSKKVEKTYVAKVAGKPTEEKLDKLRVGIRLEDGLTAPAILDLMDYDHEKKQTIIPITIHEGKNRQIRRMFEAIGHPVEKLKRIQFAMLDLSGVRRGQFRFLTKEEIKSLQSLNEQV